jgi:hypothetical protein
LLFLDPAEIWAFEAASRKTYVHCALGRFEIDQSLAELERMLGRGLLRVHRNWLVDRSHVRELRRLRAPMILFVGIYDGGEALGVEVPVSRERSHPVREALFTGAIGLRKRSASRRSASTAQLAAGDAHPVNRAHFLRDKIPVGEGRDRFEQVLPDALENPEPRTTRFPRARRTARA